MKKFIVMVALILSASLSGCSILNDSVPRDKIFSYVNDNYANLEAFPYDKMPKGEQKEKDFIKQYLGKNTIIKSVYAYNENILQFYCGGSGLVTGSTYTGFYFSKDDTPYAMEFDGCELTEIETGVFEWQNEDGSHKIHTEKIRNNWYYYIEDYY